MTKSNMTTTINPVLIYKLDQNEKPQLFTEMKH